MADPQTSTIRLTQPTVGGDSGTWGTVLNSDLTYVDEAINQTVAIPVSDTNFTVTADGSSSDQARYLRYNITGAWTAARTGTLPSNLKVGYVSNNTTGGFNLILTAGGTNLTIPPDGLWYFFQVDGSNNVSQPPVWYPANVGRNLFHNSRFNIQQRGTGAWNASGSYTADRWVLGVATDTDSVTIVSMSDSDRTAVGDEYATSALQNVFTGSATTNAGSFIAQRIESARALSNKIVTVSFWAKASSGTPKIGVGYQQNFGSGGSPSSSVLGNIGITAALSSTWTKYTVTASIPSTSGKAFGSTAGTDFTEIDFFYSAASGTYSSASGSLGAQSGTVLLWGMQIEIGSLATPLEKRDLQIDIALCQRFYSIGSMRMDFYAAVANANGSTMVAFPVTMRAIPGTLTKADSSITNVSSSVQTAISGGGFEYIAIANASGGVSITSAWTASADL